MNANTGHRRSIRLPEYDYAAPGAYFVTICVQGRACVLGDIEDGEVILSEPGQMVESWWGSIAWRFPTVGIDAYVIMPNHLHGLLRFGWDVHAADTTDSRRGRPPCLPSSIPAHTGGGSDGDGQRPTYEHGGIRTEGIHGGLPLQHDEHGEPNHAESGPVTLGRVVQWFKSATTADYRVGVERSGWPPYPGRLWQRNYYEHIVRNEAELDRIRAYIEGNPGRWAEDEEYRDMCPGFG